MDAFFASVEQRDNPDLIGKPVAVGGGGERGVISAASYEAREFGVYSAMSGALARRKCPNLLFVRPNFSKYTEVSRQIREIFSRYTDLVEPLSLDEAYLDVSYSDHFSSSATFIAQQIKNDIKNELNLNASAGVSYNKFLAKIASDMDKPDGIYVILPEDAVEFMAELPVKKFFGVGKKTAEKMNQMGIHYGKDLMPFSQREMNFYFGKSGLYYYQVIRGVDLRAVKSDRIRKSLGAENTFRNNLTDLNSQKERLGDIAEEFWRRYEKSNLKGRTITLKIKYSDFTQITRSVTLKDLVDDKKEVLILTSSLLEENYTSEKSVRLMGITISNFENESEDEDEQLTIKF